MAFNIISTWFKPNIGIYNRACLSIWFHFAESWRRSYLTSEAREPIGRPSWSVQKCHESISRGHRREEEGIWWTQRKGWKKYWRNWRPDIEDWKDSGKKQNSKDIKKTNYISLQVNTLIPSDDIHLTFCDGKFYFQKNDIKKEKSLKKSVARDWDAKCTEIKHVRWKCIADK